ncbi:TetR/AcrR family transcriptional regulator [Nocardioides sp.]|uniref:TetR/AcrR family transcriptional regulator n=1 Tax=Nocardioides sp. TaxID=35761 RepID=UPI003D13FA58
MAKRMDPTERRARIVDAALAVMLRKGIAATTVRDVAAEMGSSSGLVHHYFDSMDELLATAFDQAASVDLESTRSALRSAPDPVEQLRTFFATYIRAEQDWAFQLWLDAWAEASRRPALQATSQRLNVAWQQLLSSVVGAGIDTGSFTCADAEGTAWRILSLLDGLALQTVAHRVALDRASVLAWSVAYAESELGLAPGTLEISAGARWADGPAGPQPAAPATTGHRPSP